MVTISEGKLKSLEAVSDKNGVIRAQVPTALVLLATNVFLLYFLMMV